MKEYFIPLSFFNNKGKEIVRIRVRINYHKNILLESTTQLEGYILGKWLPIIRYDFTTKEEPNIHINKEYISTNYKEKFNCHPSLLVSIASKILQSFNEKQIEDFIKKRKEVYEKEGK